MKQLKLASPLVAGVTGALLSSVVLAQPGVSGNTISWPSDGWYQVQSPDTGQWNLCNSSENGTSCDVANGDYRVINHSTGERFELSVGGAGPANNSYRQTVDMIQFGTGNPVPGAAVLTRTANRMTLDLSTQGLVPEATYSVWWVIFNSPENCIVPNSCGEADVFSEPGVLNPVGVPAARISATWAIGFITDEHGRINTRAEIIDGALPVGTFVDNGWSSPAGFGPDENAGLVAGNGLGAEVHVVLRSHGPAVAGSVASQISTFNGLCDTQNCELTQVAIFRPPM